MKLTTHHLFSAELQNGCILPGSHMPAQYAYRQLFLLLMQFQIHILPLSIAVHANALG